FVLSVLNINEDGINDSSISWAGVSATAAISETAGVENQGELTAENYIEIANLTPTDADGAEFQYSIDTGKDQHWLFDIGTDGVLKLKWNVDYESEFWTGNVVKTTIWGHGTTGDTAGGIGDGTAYLPHEFTLTILDVEENTNKTAWSGTVPTGVAVNEDASVPAGSIFSSSPKWGVVATFAPIDTDGNEFEYQITTDATGFDAYVAINAVTGELWLGDGFNYESLTNSNITFTVYARGIFGGDPSGGAVSDTTTLNGEDGYITTAFVLSIANLNDELTEWSGRQTAAASIAETVDVPNQGDLTAANYVAVATLAASDADGDGFGYFIDGSRDQFWLFDIGTDGVLSLKYALDYESAWYPPVVKTTIWAIGTAGGAGVGDGAIAISHNFALTILNGNDADVNENITAWSGTPTTDASLRETINVENQGASELATADYVAVATFKPIDADGAGFEYAFDQSKAGWWLFDYDPSSGVLSVKYQLDYESTFYSPVVDVSIWVHGTAGGIPTNAASGVWINHNFVLSIENVNEAINDEAISWAGASATASIDETGGVVNQGELTADNYVAIATLTPTDPDGNEFTFAIDRGKDQHWLFDDIGSDGILRVRYALDYESAWYPPVVKTTIWGHGTSGGAGKGDGTAWVSHNFALTILDADDDGINNEKTAWSGT
ncbi:MAG: hypothetical protein ACR2PV_04075, partial [Gammaproteobacteria bacterium]